MKQRSCAGYVRLWSILSRRVWVVCLVFSLCSVACGQDDWWVVPGPVPEPPPVPEPTIERPEPEPQPEPSYEPPASHIPAEERPPAHHRPPAPSVPPEMRSADFLRKYFQVPDVRLPAETAGQAILLGGTGTPFFGAVARPPGVTEAEWTDLEKARAGLDALFDGKRPVKLADIDKAQKAIAQQTAVWSKAVGSPSLTPLQRCQLQLKLPTLPAPPGRQAPASLPGPISNWLPQPPSFDPSATPTVHPLGPWLADQFSDLAESGLETAGEELAEHILGEESGFGDFLGVAKIAVAYKQEGPSAALAEATDWLIGKINIPQAGFAVWGGRLAASVSFETLNRFMRDAASAVGMELDPEDFWASVRQESNVWQRAVMDFLGAPGAAAKE